MQAFRVFGNRALRLIGESGCTVQAGTPMTVTGNGTSLRVPGRGVPIFCLQISSGGPGGEAPPAVDTADRGRG
jgi:hypothetical protein